MFNKTDFRFSPKKKTTQSSFDVYKVTNTYKAPIKNPKTINNIIHKIAMKIDFSLNAIHKANKIKQHKDRLKILSPPRDYLI